MSCDPTGGGVFEHCSQAEDGAEMRVYELTPSSLHLALACEEGAKTPAILHALHTKGLYVVYASYQTTGK